MMMKKYYLKLDTRLAFYPLNLVNKGFNFYSTQQAVSDSEKHLEKI